MSRKQTIKTVKIQPKAISKSVFKSKTFKIPDESDAAQIAAAVRSAATQKAERALLDDELAKPSAVRNPALMRKFGTEHLTGTVDGYPDLDKGGKFHIVAMMPDDPGIPIEHRPTPWSVTIAITHDGNQFDFVFPFSRVAGLPSAAFKLDYIPVYLDANHNVDVELTPDYTLYEALLDYKNNDETYLNDRREIFKEVGISNGSKLDFRIRNQGFLVKSTRIKTTVSTVDKNPTATPPAVAPPTEKLYKLFVDDDIELEGSKTVGLKAIEELRNKSKIGLLGIPSSETTMFDVIVDGVVASTRYSTPIVVLDALSIEGDVIFAKALVGPTSIRKALKRELSDRVTAAEFEAWVMARNRKVLAKYKAQLA